MRRSKALLLARALLCLSEACTPKERASAPAPVPHLVSANGLEAPASDSEPDAIEKPTLAVSTEQSGVRLVTLPVPDFLDAVVAVPGGNERLSVVVATHGAGGEPEWTCNEWGRRVVGRALVLCPRGKAISLREPSGFYYPEHISLEKEVLAAVRALESGFEARIARGPMLYTGYSQGATMGALFLIGHGDRFPFLVLTEGGFSSWTRANANRFKNGGGKRILFVCGGKGCRDRAEKSATILKAAGVEARVEYVPGGGHTDGGSVGRRLDETYAWALGAIE